MRISLVYVALVQGVFGVAMAVPSSSEAQAWVAPEGNLGVALDYGFSFSNQIEEGELVVPGGNLFLQTLTLSADFVPVDRLAIRTSLPFYMLYWTNDAALRGAHGRYDDGKLHGVFQDMTWEVRYMLLDHPIAVTPSLGISFPLGSYETRGNAAAGRNLVKGHFGLNIGGFFAPWAPELYAHMRYVFSLVQSVTLNAETERFAQHHSELNFQVGYFFIPELRGYLTTDLILYHDGINFADWRLLSTNLQFNHDLLLKEELFLVGGGVGYQIDENFAVDVFFQIFVLGNNTRTTRAVGVSLSWNEFLW